MKMDQNTYEVFYDEEADFLEVFIGSPSKCLADEPEEGVFIRRDERTNEVKSVGIFSFSKRIEILKRILQKVNVSFPLDINLSSLKS